MHPRCVARGAAFRRSENARPVRETANHPRSARDQLRNLQSNQYRTSDATARPTSADHATAPRAPAIRYGPVDRKTPHAQPMQVLQHSGVIEGRPESAKRLVRSKRLRRRRPACPRRSVATSTATLAGTTLAEAVRRTAHTGNLSDPANSEVALHPVHSTTAPRPLAPPWRSVIDGVEE